jgi:cell filamentation protein, protein adenylyltransferase
MNPSDRYDTSGLSEDQFEPGSDGRVLKNLLGITTREKMETAETAELWLAEEQLLGEIEQDQSFTAQDIRNIHHLWLGKIYPWAGDYRQVNLSKDGFTFALAHTIPALMDEFERDQLRRFTPCNFSDRETIARALGEVHVELMLIHPFREGNGRLGRLLATLMGLQAGLPLLDFSEVAGWRKEEYFAAIRAGLDRDYRLMVRLFSDVLELSS